MAYEPTASKESVKVVTETEYDVVTVTMSEFAAKALARLIHSNMSVVLRDDCDLSSLPLTLTKALGLTESDLRDVDAKNGIPAFSMGILSRARPTSKTPRYT